MFFAQVVDEALFDFTLDSYKPLALNIRLLCIEGLVTLDNIKKGLIKKPSVKSIIEELIWNLNTDCAVKRILGPKCERFLERIKFYECNLAELKETILHLYHHFNNKKYLKYIQDILIELVPGNKEKEHIYYLSKAYLTELINYGYLPGYIYFQVNQYFFNKSNPVSDKSPEQFFNIFDFKTKLFKVVFRVDNVFNEFTPLSKILNFSIQNSYPSGNLFGFEKDFIDNKPPDDIFIVFDDVKSTNEISARYDAERPIARIANMFSFFHHKEKPKIFNKALVINKQSNAAILLDKPIKSIIKKEDIRPRDAVIKVKNIFDKLDLPEETILALTKTIDIHSIALETDEIENKLLNLWTAIETLIPKDFECEQDRIIQIIQGLSPFQSIFYIKNILNEVAKDFFLFNQRMSSLELKKVIVSQPESRWGKIAALLTTKENESIRNGIYLGLNDFPLLRWRIFSINKHFFNGKSVKKMLNDHNRKIEWQIRRIYRVRNLIVHSGVMPSYTNILVENLHNYYDNMVNYIFDAASNNEIQYIKEGVVACDIGLKVLLNNIDEIGEDEISLANFKLIT